jgi:hypothetical protein
MISINRRSLGSRGSRRTRWQRARGIAIGLGLSATVGVACGTGPVGGGTGGSGGGNECIDTGDRCTPGVPIPREQQCVRGVDCCVNTCTCGDDGTVRCQMKCDPSSGSGGSCGSDAGGPGTRCVSDSQCGTGLKCCYPCGIPDCENQCMAPMPNGQCPLFP